ncbi:MAG: hypothetical protein HKP30_09645 [Myxococcales bacterium]|nr:hypothetical protein [Myxococcales bacterium]
MGEDQAEHVQRHVDGLGAAGPSRVDAVVVEALDLGQADRADIHVLEVRRQVDLHLEAVDAGGPRRVVTFQATLDRELDLPAKPILGEATEGNGRLLLGRLGAVGRGQDHHAAYGRPSLSSPGEWS